jgi:hypothetical protein
LYPALDLGQSDSRNLADACGHGWDRLGARAVHCRHADPFGWRDLHLTVRDVGHLAARATGEAIRRKVPERGRVRGAYHGKSDLAFRILIIVIGLAPVVLLFAGVVLIK